MIKFLFNLIILLVLIPVLVIGGIFAFLYFNYLRIQPADYSFVGERADILSIEYARFTFSDEGLTPTKVGIITDSDAFMNDFDKIDSHTGINVNDLLDLINGKPIDGIVINYKNGEFEFITPYICVNSSFNPKTVAELLNTRVHGFDATQFANLIDNIDKYALELPTDSFDKIEEGLDKIPEGVIPEN